MDEKVLEAVARAICTADGVDPDAVFSGEAGDEYMWSEYEDQARAAIAAYEKAKTPTRTDLLNMAAALAARGDVVKVAFSSGGGGGSWGVRVGGGGGGWSQGAHEPGADSRMVKTFGRGGGGGCGAPPIKENVMVTFNDDGTISVKPFIK